MRIFLIIFSIAIIACGQNVTEEKVVVEENQLTGVSVTKTKSELLTVTSFAKKIENKSVQLLDVRTPEEFNNGAIGNAKNIDYYAASFKEQLLHLDKNMPVAIYCKSGGRSGRTAKILMSLGFKEVYDLKGGYLNWKSNN